MVVIDYLQEKVGPDTVVRSDLVLVDANWASDERDRKSMSGYTVFLYGSFIAWFCVKQKLVSLSLTESKYMGLTHVLKELSIPCLFLLESNNQASLKVTSSITQCPTWNILTSAIISFASIYILTISLHIEYLPSIWQLICSQSFSQLLCIQNFFFFWVWYLDRDI